MQNQNIQKIVIVGGGTAGWMSAAALSKLLKSSSCQIQLVESALIPNIGVGEATIPQLQLFNSMLGINEDDFVKQTQATFKHGIEFVNWKQPGHSYIHPFGGIGLPFEGVDFHNFWLKQHAKGQVDALDPYAFNCVAAKQNKMMRSVNIANSPLNNIAYAFHFDSNLYIQYLQKMAIKAGVERIEAKVNQVDIHPKTGFIDSIKLDTNQQLNADLFIDCSGFKGILIEQALHSGYESWNHWLPCDSAVVAPSTLTTEPAAYTRSTAHNAGWQWKIPLQHRMGNGHVYASRFISDEQAKKTLTKNIDGALLAEPRVLRFNTGRRLKQWHKNCVSLGLSAGFIEPLESTAIHLIQSGIARLMSLFPDKSFAQADIDTFNRQSKQEMEYVRDFIILHYKITNRNDTPFWNYVRNMQVPENLQRKIDLFKSHGRIFRENDELFNESSWLAVMIGQGLIPKKYHPLADSLSDEEISYRMQHVKEVIEKSVAQMPTHSQFIKQHCQAQPDS